MNKWNKRLVLGLAAAPLMVVAAAALPALAAGNASSSAATRSADTAPGYGYGNGMGPGMMGGYGPGYAGGWQRGAQDTPSRPWGHGGYGGYGGFGPGMMGGYGGYSGFGPGMMGGFRGYGYGMGPWMMGGYGAWGPTPRLSDPQRGKIEGIEKALFNKQWALMQSMQKLMFDAWQPAAGDKLDVDAIMKRATALSNTRLQMLRNRLEAAGQIDAVLTPQQRESLGETH